MCNVFSKRYYHNGTALRPAKNKFKLGKEPYTLSVDDLIKTDGVYQFCYVRASPNYETVRVDCTDSLSRKEYIRFFKNGRCLVNRIDQEKDLYKQYGDVNAGNAGYYKIEDGFLFLEYFSVNVGGMTSDCGRYYLSKYKIEDGSIELISERRSSSNVFYAWVDVKKGQVFKKIDVDGIEGRPDW